MDQYSDFLSSFWTNFRCRAAQPRRNVVFFTVLSSQVATGPRQLAPSSETKTSQKAGVSCGDFSVSSVYW